MMFGLLFFSPLYLKVILAKISNFKKKIKSSCVRPEIRFQMEQLLSCNSPRLELSIDVTEQTPGNFYSSDKCHSF